MNSIHDNAECFSFDTECRFFNCGQKTTSGMLSKKHNDGVPAQETDRGCEKMMNGIEQAVKIFRPAETGPHERTLMAWPQFSKDLYGDGLEDMRKGYALIARTIARFEPVTMIAHPGHAASARQALGNEVEVSEMLIDDCWIRDSGPTCVRAADGGLRRGLAVQCLGRQAPPLG